MRRNELSADIEKEITGYMPEKFVVLYHELCRRGYKQVKDSLDGAGDVRAPRRPSSEGAVLGSDDALTAKRRIDRILRQLAREGTLGTKEDASRCTACRRFIQKDWKHCPWCGVDTSKKGIQGSEGVEEIKVDREVSGKVWSGVQLR